MISMRLQCISLRLEARPLHFGDVFDGCVLWPSGKLFTFVSQMLSGAMLVFLQSELSPRTSQLSGQKPQVEGAELQAAL